VTGADNHRSPSVGGEEATLLVSNRSLTGRSDRLDLFLSYAEGLLDGYVAYTAPVNPLDTTMSLYAERTDTDILEGDFDEIDIQSTISTVGILFNHPLQRSLSGDVDLFAGFEYKHTQNKLLGSRFSFTPGERKGETDLSVFQAGVELSRLSLERVMATRLTIRRGLHIFGATETPATGPRAGTPDGQFTSLLWQAQYIRNLDWRASQLFLRTSAQWAGNPLLSAEKMPVGGYNTVRGYRENLFVRDNGFAGSVEWQVPLFEVDRSIAGAFDARRLRGATFLDYGASKDKTNDLNTGDTKNLYSVGLGLLWDPKPGLHAEAYWGHALQHFHESGNNIQDDGLTFRVSYQF
jgi:hemolysin activation/secretion protein